MKKINTKLLQKGSTKNHKWGIYDRRIHELLSSCMLVPSFISLGQKFQNSDARNVMESEYLSSWTCYPLMMVGFQNPMA